MIYMVLCKEYIAGLQGSSFIPCKVLPCKLGCSNLQDEVMCKVAMPCRTTLASGICKILAKYLAFFCKNVAISLALCTSPARRHIFLQDFTLQVCMQVSSKTLQACSAWVYSYLMLKSGPYYALHSWRCLLGLKM